MADDKVTDLPETVPETVMDSSSAAAVDMEFEAANPCEPESDDGDTNDKRGREEGGDEDGEENGGGEAKRQKIEKSAEEERLENLETAVDGEGGNGSGSDLVVLGPKKFGTSVEMFDYFYKFLHFWPPNLNVNKYEHMVLLDLLKKGHLEPEKKIGQGIRAFQVRYHPQWKSRCFFLVREDESSDDFSFRKCVDHLLSLPENMQIKPEVNKALGGGGRGGGRGHWRGRGRGGKQRN